MPNYEAQRQYFEEVEGVADSTFRHAVVQTRMDECTIKFWPDTLLPSQQLAMQPINVASAVIGYVRDAPPIRYQGDYEPAIIKALGEDPLGGTQPLSVGCIVDSKKRLPAAVKRLRVWSPPDIDDNNCFLRCLYEAKRCMTVDEPSYKSRGMEELYEMIQEPRDNHINENDLQEFADAFEENYELYEIAS